MKLGDRTQGEYIQVQKLSNNRKLQIYLSQSKQIVMPAMVTDEALTDNVENLINALLPLFLFVLLLGLILGQT